MKVSQRDIAKAAGVSQPTVSLCFNKKHKAIISDETRAKVLKIAKEDTGMFIVDFFLPDMHTAQRTEISVQEEGSQEWVSIAQGVFKPELATEAESAYYTRFFPIRKDARIARCRINTYGYGGQGFTFVKIVNSAGHRVPYALLGIDGRVENPENLFSDDRQWCFMGEQDIRYAFKNRGLESSMHTVIIEMH
jgi:transcriptional regulator with XRE-family HTH domain